jgi:hypothetical protein
MGVGWSVDCSVFIAGAPSDTVEASFVGSLVGIPLLKEPGWRTILIGPCRR